ncbi:MAG: GNAT family N-acetyltransferase [Boseongicola sp.]|nr:MAG: GNAT family N-acetyltransferase [Boseongicola sp.]
MQIRPVGHADIKAIYEISLATGDAGKDARSLHNFPNLIGEIYSAPYAILEPERAFVVEDKLGVAGFVLGTADTRGFEAQLDRDWWPAVRRRCPEPDAGDSAQTEEDRRRLEKIHDYPPIPEWVVTDYPAHMHMNLLTRARGQGVGRALFQRFVSTLTSEERRKLHIQTNKPNLGGIAFWKAMGFRPLDMTDGDHVWMGLVET